MPDFLRMMGGTVNETIEWIAVFSFVAFAVVYFLAPVLGYASSSRGTLSLALYALIGYGVLTLLQAVITYFLYLVSSESSNTGMKAIVHFNFIFGILKLLVFIVAEAAFAFGLQKLTRTSGIQA